MSPLITIALLAIMEVSLSFDNAVINASVLQKMSAKWQRRFLTWGILVAVVGMRLVFPVLIVAVASGLNMLDVAKMAINEPAVYGQHVTDAHVPIAFFGGMFLLLVFLHFICDHEKDTHWIHIIESRLAKLGRLESVQVMLALTTLAVVSIFIPAEERIVALVSGIIGVITYIAIKGTSGLISGAGTAAVCSGFMGFLYLEVLDASFSLDGVVAAFAISNDIATIMLGLGIGALCVRWMTVVLVRNGTLKEFIYLEHGAHWGIGALAILMLMSAIFPIPELITGLIGVSMIGLSLASSIHHKRAIANEPRRA